MMFDMAPLIWIGALVVAGGALFAGGTAFWMTRNFKGSALTALSTLVVVTPFYLVRVFAG